jgi:hypothetical protein
MSNNAVCHVEISVSDAVKAGGFYKDLFGWEIDNSMGDGYVFFKPADGPGGAFSKVEGHTPGNNVVYYIHVDDIEAYLNRAKKLGGKEVVAKTEIPGHGWYGHAADLDGNLIGLFTARQG